ncbi:TATA-box-binding protein 2-like isoform X3 [Poecilia reticulata]|uniref:TATA-box-binding protein 2-like isoform X3 n=1 Tax=Poecilia reticulata TaxID=8081 RepID=UPI0007EB641F|nr:PREDICTED: TATA-box-binding protein 2-like isoform X3 [Poecilia reticulata]
MDSVMDWHNLEHFFEKYILTDTKQEEIKDVIKELMICLEQNNTAEHNNMTLDVLPSNSTFSIPPSVPEKPVDLTFKPQINNVLSTAKLGCKLDLDFIVRNTWNCEYNPKTFPAITIRIRKPRSTARLFRNGTLVCAGATSIDESHRAARKFARIVQKLNFPVRLLNFQIKNILPSGVVPKSLFPGASWSHCHCLSKWDHNPKCLALGEESR